MDGDGRFVSLWALLLLSVVVLMGVLWTIYTATPVSEAADLFSRLGFGGEEVVPFDRLLVLAAGLGVAGSAFVVFLKYLYDRA